MASPENAPISSLSCACGAGRQSVQWAGGNRGHRHRFAGPAADAGCQDVTDLVDEVLGGSAPPESLHIATWPTGIRDVDTDGIYPNSLTFRSLDLARSYEPVNFIDRVAPTPLLMLVADRDTTTLPAWQVEAFDRGGDPKRLERFGCGHYALYTDYLVQAADKATEWFDEHLRG